MDLQRMYGYLVQVRKRLFDEIRSLSDEQHGREFPIGSGSIGRTLTHILISEWYYVERMLSRTVPPYEDWDIREETPLPLATLEARWAEQAAATHAALGTVADWDAAIDYEVRDDDGQLWAVRTTVGDLFTQLMLHEVHHRAQVLNMLRQLGVKLEDVDYNALMYDRRKV